MNTIFRWDEITNRIVMTKDAEGTVTVSVTAETGAVIDENTAVIFAISDDDSTMMKKAVMLRVSSTGWCADITITAEDVRYINCGRYTWNAVLVTDPAYDDSGIPYADERSDQVVPLWTGNDRPEFILEDPTIMDFVLSGDMTVMVPRFIRNDTTGYAMTKALQAVTDYFTSRIHAALINLLSVDDCAEWRLDELAWEYAAEWYDYSDPVETKREVIRNIRSTYAKLGTVDAVTSVLQDVFESAYVKEWFKYSGTAGHFKVITNDQTQTDSKAKMTEKMIRVVKRVGSVLDEISVEGSGGTAETIATAAAGPQVIRGYSATAR